MNSNNQLKAGAVLSYLNLALSMLIPFFYTPVMLRLLGESEYGLYSLSSSVISYLSLLSFGFGSTIIRYISIYRGKNDQKHLREAYGFFILLYCVIALVVMTIGIILAYHTNQIFHRGLTAAEMEKMRTLMLIMTINSALSFPVSVFSSVIMSYEKYIYRKCVDMIGTVAAPLSNLILLYMGFGSVGMAWTSTVIQFIMLPLNIWYCRKVIGIKPSFHRLPWNLIHEMLGFSAFIFIGTIVDMLFWSTDKVILGMLAGTTIVAVYNIGSTFNSMVTSLSTAISGVLTPRITNMVAKDASPKELTELFIKIGRIQFIIVALIVSGFVAFGKQFVWLWAGQSYADAYWIAIVTLIPLCVPLIQNTGLSIVVAKNKHQFRSIVYLIIAIVNVISTYLVVPRWGGLGAAACSGVSYIVGQGIIMNIYYVQVIGIDIPLFWKNILKMAVVPVLLCVGAFGLEKYISLYNWYSFLCAVIIYTFIYGGMMYAVALNNYEKDLLSKPVIMILKRCRIFKG